MSRLSRRSVLAAGGAVLASMVTGCARGVPGSPGPGIEPPPGVGSELDPAVLDAWRDFPVTRSPRPILLLSGPLRETGYHTDDAKLAVATGRYELVAKLPSTRPAGRPVALPDGPYTLPLITATEAFERLRATGDPGNAPGADPTPLRITKVELGSAPFGTDRGERELPAWLFHAPDSFEPLAWPALAPEAFWRLGDLPPAGDTLDAKLAADGVTLTVTMPAPYPGACPGDPIYRHVPVVIERATAVAVGVRAEVVSIAPGPRRDDCGYDAMLRLKEYTVRIRTPLGHRVLIGASGGPVPVKVTG
jgi:hypothetical protein